MPLGFLTTFNVLNNSESSNGKKPSEMQGSGGVVAGFTLIASATGLVPGTGTITVTPSEGAFASGADGDGNISVQVTWINSGNDVDWLLVGGGTHAFPDGFWNTLCRSILSLPSNTIGFDIQFSNNDVLGYTVDLVGGPGPNTYHDPSWDGDKGIVTLDVHYDDVDSEHPNSIAILKDGVVVASFPVTADKDYTYVDTVFAPGTVHYSFLIYKYPNSRGVESSSFAVTFGGPPTVEITMSGGITFGGSATIQFLGNPTGTYTIVKDKTNDTLYNTDNDVAIPNPFIITGFLPQ